MKQQLLKCTYRTVERSSNVIMSNNILQTGYMWCIIQMITHTDHRQTEAEIPHTQGNSARNNLAEKKKPQNISNEKGDFYIWRWLGFPGHSTFTEIMALSALPCPGHARTRQVLAGAISSILLWCFKDDCHYYHICKYFLVTMTS